MTSRNSFKSVRVIVDRTHPSDVRGLHASREWAEAVTAVRGQTPAPRALQAKADMEHESSTVDRASFCAPCATLSTGTSAVRSSRRAWRGSGR
eukprot:2417887-Prymnesium_polylepis.2